MVTLTVAAVLSVCLHVRRDRGGKGVRSIPGILAASIVLVVDSGAVGAGVSPAGGAGDSIIVITIAVRVVMVV